MSILHNGTRPPDFRDTPPERTDKTARSPSDPLLSVLSVPSQGVSGNLDWPDPQPLPDELPPVPQFDLSMLPDQFRQWIADIAERLQCPPEFPAVAAIVAAAATIGRKVTIRPKRHDDWTVVPVLWGMLVGRPSLMKTPAVREGMKPLQRLDIESEDQFKREDADRKRLEPVRKAQKDELQKQLAKAVREGGGTDAIADAIARIDEDLPIRRRFIVNDSTVEKLGEVLRDNPNGVLQFRDELIGFLRSLDKEGHETDRAFYLECWNGNGRFTYDRIGRGTQVIQHAIVSVLGGIQPSRIVEYLRDARTSGAGDDGLIQRFQLAVWPDASTVWRNVDRWPDSEARNTAYAVFRRLAELTPEIVNAEPSQDGAFLRFDLSAQVKFTDWLTTLENRLRSDELPPCLESHLGKYRSLVPSLSLVFHLIDDGCGPIPPASIDRAIQWTAFLESHAQRLYAGSLNPENHAARLLARKIKKGGVPARFLLRDHVYRNGWTGLSTSEDATAAADLLVSLGWLKEEPQDTPGRRKVWYVANPKILQTHQDRTDRTDKSPLPTLLAVPSVPPEGHSEENDDWGEV